MSIFQVKNPVLGLGLGLAWPGLDTDRTEGEAVGVQPPVTFPIGDHVNVLHDYKKTGPSKIQKLVLVTHLKCLNVPCPSIFFYNFCMN